VVIAVELVCTEADVCEVLNEVEEQIERGGSRFPGMTYEQGIAEALKWAIGDTDEHPYPKQ
jgi:hypothetical protein